MNRNRIALYAAAGGLLGTLGDRVHTATGVLWYPHPTLFEEAWWVVPLMAAAGVVMGLGHGAIRRRFDEPADGTERAVWIALAWFMVCYVASGVMKDYPIALTLAFGSAFVARALSRPPSRVVWVHGVLIALGGTLWEAGLSASGAFHYARPGILGVPGWLPGLYLQASLLSREMERRWPVRTTS